VGKEKNNVDGHKKTRAEGRWHAKLKICLNITGKKVRKGHKGERGGGETKSSKGEKKGSKERKGKVVKERCSEDEKHHQETGPNEKKRGVGKSKMWKRGERDPWSQTRNFLQR